MPTISADEEEIILFRPLWQPPEGQINKQQRIMAELDFQPLADVMAGNDLELKRGAIEKLAQIRTPDAIGTLLTHRSDLSPEIRFYITAALARVKNDYDEQLEAAKVQMQKDIYKISARFFLAKCYLEYASSQLLDEATESSYLKEARYHLEYCSDSEHVTVEMKLALVQLYVDTKELEKAEILLGHIIESAPDKSLEAVKLMAQIHFKKGHYAGVVNQLGTLARVGNLPPEWNAVIDWWEAAPAIG